MPARRPVLSAAYVQDDSDEDDAPPPSPTPQPSRTNRYTRRDNGRMKVNDSPSAPQAISDVDYPANHALPVPRPFFPEFENPSTPARPPAAAASQPSPFYGRTEWNGGQADGEKLERIREEMEGLGMSMGQLLNAVVESENVGVREELGQWFKGKGMENYLKRWSGKERWATKEVGKILKKEVRTAEKSGDFSLPRSEYTNESAVKLDLEQLSVDVQSSLPVATQLIGVLMGVDRKKRKRSSTSSKKATDVSAPETGATSAAAQHPAETEGGAAAGGEEEGRNGEGEDEEDEEDDDYEDENDLPVDENGERYRPKRYRSKKHVSTRRASSR
jgi:hypothetical protein